MSESSTVLSSRPGFGSALLSYYFLLFPLLVSLADDTPVTGVGRSSKGCLCSLGRRSSSRLVKVHLERVGVEEGPDHLRGRDDTCHPTSFFLYKKGLYLFEGEFH